MKGRQGLRSKRRRATASYVEGTLTLNTWNDKATGEAKTGLNVAAWKCERVASIGKSRERYKPGAYQANGEPARQTAGREHATLR